jgi:hypothetical protein
MAEKIAFERSRPLRGRPYSLDEFQAKYGLQRQNAEDLFRRFGPSSVELDLLMSAKKWPPSIDKVTEDISL